MTSADRGARAACAALLLMALGGCAALPSGGLQDLAEALETGPDTRALPPPTLADAARPRLRAGDTFVFGRQTVRRVEAVRADGITWSTTDGQRLRATPHFFAPLLQHDLPERALRSTIEGDPGALWPLRAGRSVRFTETRTERLRLFGVERRSQRHWHCEVRGTRHVSVPAGDFDAFHVRCEARAAERSVGPPLQVIDWDYAPSMGHYVRRQWFEQGQRRESVLSAALPGELATEARLARVLERLRNAP